MTSLRVLLLFVALLVGGAFPVHASVVDAAPGGFAEADGRGKKDRGRCPGGLGSLAPGVDMVLGTHVARLKRLLDTGRPE